MIPVGCATGLLSARLSPSSPPSTSSKPSSTTASNLNIDFQSSEEKAAAFQRCLGRSIRCCPCGRRHLLGASATTILLSFSPWKAANSLAFATDVSMQKFCFARQDWYDEVFADAMEKGMRSYEAEIAGYKADLFSHFAETTKKILELGVGTGPNFKYYTHAVDLHIVGIDPNKHMEKYARNAALAAGLPHKNFTFMQGMGEYLPFEDGSIDAVVGTLVLCSVKDVHRTLQEVRRVLKAGGLYFFIEHVAAPDCWGSIPLSCFEDLSPYIEDSATRCMEDWISTARGSTVFNFYFTFLLHTLALRSLVAVLKI